MSSPEDVSPGERTPSRAAWPNSRDDRATRTGRRAAVPAPASADVPAVPTQRGRTALATPPDGIAELAALLGVPVQRSAPPRALDLPPSHPSAPVPAPQPPLGWTEPGQRVPGQRVGVEAAPSAREQEALPSRRRRRAAALPAPVTDRVPVQPRGGGERLSAPAVTPAEQPLPGTRRARRAAVAPLDAPPRTSAPALPGSRRALREQSSAPAESDTDVLSHLEALLSAPVAPAEVMGLDLRTDPQLRSIGWSRHTPVEEPAAPAPAPVATALAVAEALRGSSVVAEDVAFAPRRGRGAHRLPKRARAVLPQVAVVSVLGVATLVAPLVGTHLRAEADSSTGTASSVSADAGASTVQAAAAASAAGAADLLAERASAALSRSSARDDVALQEAAHRAEAAKVEQDRIAAEAQAKAEADRVAAEAAARVAEEHRAAIAALVGECSGQRPDLSGTKNGRLTDDQMCDLSIGGSQAHLRSDAAVAFAELNLAYREHFGEDMVITDSYRSYNAQVAVRRKKPGLAAVPGTSEHGWGLAVDLGDGVQKSDEHYEWLIKNAPAHGWDHPAWARKGGSGPFEPWHWEFVAGE